MTNVYPLQSSTNTQVYPPLLQVANIGDASSGAFSFINGQYTFTGLGGVDFFQGTSDNLSFFYRFLIGDGTIIVRTVSFSNNGWIGNPGQSFGIMMRETLDPGSKFVGAIEDYVDAFVGPNAPWTYYRDTTDAEITYTDFGDATYNSPGFPIWFQLTRAGDLFTTQTSTDGITWTVGTPVTVPMAQTIYAGIAISNPSQVCDNFSFVSGNYG